jgi:predicted amidophosphoribosyltransferase
MKSVLCSGCGAQLDNDSDRCPLCGAEPRAKVARRASKPVDVEDYQSDVRKLREQLKKLRDKGAEAV